MSYSYKSETAPPMWTNERTALVFQLLRQIHGGGTTTNGNCPVSEQWFTNDLSGFLKDAIVKVALLQLSNDSTRRDITAGHLKYTRDEECDDG